MCKHNDFSFKGREKKKIFLGHIYTFEFTFTQFLWKNEKDFFGNRLHFRSYVLSPRKDNKYRKAIKLIKSFDVFYIITFLDSKL